MCILKPLTDWCGWYIWITGLKLKVNGAWLSTNPPMFVAQSPLQSELIKGKNYKKNAGLSPSNIALSCNRSKFCNFQTYLMDKNTILHAYTIFSHGNFRMGKEWKPAEKLCIDGISICVKISWSVKR